MSEHMSVNRGPGGQRDEAPIADLIRLAGRRPEPAAFRAARVRAVVEAEWRRSLPRRSGWLLWPLTAAAAVAVLALVLWARTPARQPAPPTAVAVQELATVARVTGPVRVVPPGSTPRTVAVGERMAAGWTIDTHLGGRAALTFDAGSSVRLDRGSQIVLETMNRVTLERGRVYVDSGEDADPRDGLSIATRSGIVREIGTQFEVDAQDSFIQIRVRDGAVRIDRSNQSVDIGEAEAVRIGPDGGLERKTIARSGPEWSWAEAIAPPFTVEGATLEAFLQWVSREQGWEWQFRDAAAARYGHTVVLHGTIEGLTPAEALDAVLPTCGMAYQLRDARLLVGVAPQ